MKLLNHLLPLVLVCSALGAEGAEETKKPQTRESSSKRAIRTNSSKGTEKQKATEKTVGQVGKATPGEGGQTTGARLKALESENARLRLELAAKGGAAPLAPGAEAATPDGALAELQAGNSRFVLGARTRSQLGVNDPALRQTLAKGQAPFAIIVTCSDSRLGENYIFDQELGRLFTVREAGNCPDTQGLASIEYAVEHLGSKLVVVMGHDSCGAVKAVKDSGPAILPGNLWSLQAGMAGLLDSVHPEAGESAATHLGRLVQSNAERQARIVLGRSTIVQHLCASGKLKVVPAVYDLASGKVKFLAAVGTEPAKAEHH